MKLEDLIKLGLTEEQANKVLEAHQAAINGNYVPKATFEAERDKVKAANDTIAERDKQITELGKFKGTAEELQAKVTELTNANETAKTEYETKLKEKEEEFAIRTALADKVHNADDILPKLDKSKLTITDGKVTGGLNDQLEAIKKTNPYYFKEQSGSNPGGLPAGFQMFGQQPGAGKGTEVQSDEVNFGKQLAESQLSGMNAAAKGGEHYFK